MGSEATFFPTKRRFGRPSVLTYSDALHFIAMQYNDYIFI